MKSVQQREGELMLYGRILDIIGWKTICRGSVIIRMDLFHIN